MTCAGNPAFGNSEQNAGIASDVDKEQKEHMEGGVAQALVKQKGGWTCGNPAHPFSMRSRNVGARLPTDPAGNAKLAKGDEGQRT